MFCELLKKATNGLTGLCTASSCTSCKLFPQPLADKVCPKCKGQKTIEVGVLRGGVFNGKHIECPECKGKGILPHKPPQPLDEGLKVLVDGEWVEASKELKETARSIEQALPNKERRKIAGQPTVGQVREFWRRCGFVFHEPTGRVIRLPSGESATGWVMGAPAIDLNNLFQYVVPEDTKVILSSREGVTKCFLDSTEQYIGVVREPKAWALALYRALQKFLEGGQGCLKK